MNEDAAGRRAQYLGGESSLRRTYRRFARNRVSLVGSLIVAIVTFIANCAPVLTPYDPLKTDLRSVLEPPSHAHVLGTDELGRDLLSRIIAGSRISVSVGVLAVILGLLVGVPIGLITGYFGGLTDSVGMRLVDVLLAFPRLLLALLVMAALGVGLRNTAIAVSVFSIPIFARVARATALKLREQDFVDAARALGARNGWILVKHILPNTVTPIIALTSVSIARAIITVAALSFLGLGAKPPTPEWGAMMAEGRSFLRQSPHISLFPGMAITFVVLGFNFVGDGLRDALDPRAVR